MAAPPSRVVYRTLTQSAEEQRLPARPLPLPLTRRPGGQGHTGAARPCCRGPQAGNPRCSKGSWRAAALLARSTKSSEDRRLGQLRSGVSLGAAASAPLRADLKRRMDGIRPTADGVVQLTLCRRSKAQPERRTCTPALHSRHRRLPQEQRSPGLKRRSPSSLRPELTGIALACEASPTDEDLII